MNGYLVKSILGLTLTTAVVTGGVIGVSKMQENKGVASDNPEAIVLETDKVADETLSAENENELLSLEKLNEENSSEIEETDLEEEETVTEETAEEEKEEEAVEKEDTKPSEKKEEAKAETTTETAETTTETTSEQPSETAEQPTQTTTTETVAEVPVEQPTEQVQTQSSQWSCPLAPIADDGSDSARMYNEMVASTSMEEYMQRADALANASFDINGNLVDPSMIVVEPEPSTTTEVIEEIEVTE